MANIYIIVPEDYKLYFHTSMEGHVWLDGKGKPIPLDQPLVNHVDSSRCTRKSIHPKDTHPRKEGAYKSTTIDKDTPHFNSPLCPIMETTINMPQSDGLSPEDTIVQDIMADPNINPNLLQAAINTLSSRIIIMQLAHTTPTSITSPYDHQGSAIESSDSIASQSNHSSNNQPQHPP